jgi:hypothetical protein
MAKKKAARMIRVSSATTLSSMAVNGISTASGSTALNTTDAVLTALRSVKPNPLSPVEIVTATGLAIGVVTSDLIFLIGVGLASVAPNDMSRFVAV